MRRFVEICISQHEDVQEYVGLVNARLNQHGRKLKPALRAAGERGAQEIWARWCRWCKIFCK